MAISSSVDWNTFNNKQAAGSYANTALSNLSAVAINLSLTPGTTNTISLGSNTSVWNTAFVNNIDAVSGITATVAINVSARQLFDNSAVESADWRIRHLISSLSVTSIDWDGQLAYDSGGNLSIDWNARNLYDSAGTIQATWGTTGFDVATILLLKASTSGVFKMKAAATTTPYTITWPSAVAWRSMGLFFLAIVPAFFPGVASGGGGGAIISTALNFLVLTPTSINVSLLPQLGLSLGGGFNPWIALWMGTGLSTAGIIQDTDFNGNTGQVIDTFNNYLVSSFTGPFLPTVDWNNQALMDSINSGGSISLDWQNQLLFDQSNTMSGDWNNRLLYHPNGSVTVDWRNEQLSVHNAGGADLSLDWQARRLWDINGNTSAIWGFGGEWNLQHNGVVAVDWRNRFLTDNGPNTTVDWQNLQLYSAGNVTVDWGQQFLYDVATNIIVDWNNRILYDPSEIAQFSWSTAGVVIGPPGVTTETHAINTATGTPTNTVTPVGYIQIAVNGTTSYVPYYQ